LLMWLPAALVGPTAFAAPPITAAAFAPDGRSVVVGSQAGIEILAWPHLDRVRVIETQLENVHDLAFAPSGTELAAAGGTPGVRGGAEFFSWPDANLIHRTDGHDDLVYAIAWRNDSQVWASAGGDREVRIHRASDGALERTLTGHSRPVLAVAWLPEAQPTLASAGTDQTLRVWEVQNGRQLRSLDNHTGAVTALALRPGTREGEPLLLASAGADRTLRLWQPLTGRLVRFARLESNPLAAAWTADGRRLAVSCADGHLRVFDPSTMLQVQDIAALDGWAYTLVAAPSGHEMFVGGADGQMRRVEIAVDGEE
jgi:WD40 repeat protein